MAETYDAIVIGAGHNGLTCACYLAKAGLRTLLLEQHHAVGGMTSTDEITLPGFHSDLHAFGYQLAHLSPAPAELELEQHGFRLLPTDPGYSHVFPDGGSLSMRATVDDTCASIARYSEADAATWRRLFEQYLGQKEALRRAFNSVPPSLGDEVTALQHIPGGWDEYRFNLQSVRSWADETFQSPEAKVFLGTFGIHVGAAPDDAGGAAFAWLIDMLVQDFGNTVVAGGMGNLASASSSRRGGRRRCGSRTGRRSASAASWRRRSTPDSWRSGSWAPTHSATRSSRRCAATSGATR
jgi:beta-carotene ketolase (CrtO type)